MLEQAQQALIDLPAIVRSVHPDFGSAPDYLPRGRYWPIVRTSVLILAIGVTLVAILLLYGGNIQNANIGPVALRSRANMGPSFFKAPRTIVGSTLEGKVVRCTFYLSYVNHAGKNKIARLSRDSNFRFKLSALGKRHPLARADMFGFWNPSFDRSLQDKFVESGIPTAPEDRAFFMRDHTEEELKKIISEDTEIVDISPAIWNEIAKGQKDFIAAKLDRFGRFYARQKGKRRENFRKAPAYRELPDFSQDANIYMRMHFSANPLTHPDPQVKTTAWLTVLTSLFALLTQWLYTGF
ncbi:MAG: hypothetical protein ABUS57_02540 [Pseudomonadota bacterium]